MTAPTTEKAYEKYAWIIFFAFGIGTVIGALADIFAPLLDPEVEIVAPSLAGKTWGELIASNPWIAGYTSFYIIASAPSFLGLGLFGLAITLKGYRNGEKWAWYTLWYLPAAYFFYFVLFYGFSSTFILLWILLVIIFVIGLLLPYRKFFPRK